MRIWLIHCGLVGPRGGVLGGGVEDGECRVQSEDAGVGGWERRGLKDDVDGCF